jgi:hypothetical protein
MARTGRPNPVENMTPCFHYLANGETNALRRIWEYLEERCKAVDKRFHHIFERKLSRHCINDDGIVRDNLVIFGNQRTNSLLEDRQKGCKFLLEDMEIRNVLGTGEVTYRNTDNFTFVVVTRKHNPTTNAVVTMIGANHSRASEEISKYLTDPVRLDSMYQQLKIKNGASLPLQFQLLFRVHMDTFETPDGAKLELSDFESVSLSSPSIDSPKTKRRSGKTKGQPTN